MQTDVFSQKIPVAVLGATGAVGQRFVQLLDNHPWFKVVALTGSERSSGEKYAQVCNWVLDGDPPEAVRDLVVLDSKPGFPAKIVFSALPAVIARQVEPEFSRAGYAVCSNASAFRQEADVPLIIPEINAEHLSMLENQRSRRGWPGLIVTSPNCTTTGLAIPLKPLNDAFGVQQVMVTSMQAVSGSGYPGVPYMDIFGNVIPYIGGEEEKLGSEPCLLLGSISNGERIPAEIAISAQANRVPVLDGHTLSIALKCERPLTPEAAAQALAEFRAPEDVRSLPSAPAQLIRVRSDLDRPQPRRDRAAGEGMTITVGRIRACPVLDLRLVSVVHNTLRGAASGAILNAELLLKKGWVSA